MHLKETFTKLTAIIPGTESYRIKKEADKEAARVRGLIEINNLNPQVGEEYLGGENYKDPITKEEPPMFI